jgi:NitT/TauT family transport system permease protein
MIPIWPLQVEPMALWAESAVLPAVRPARRSKLIAAIVAKVLPAALFCILLAMAWQVMAARAHSPLIPGLWEVGEELQAIFVSGKAFAQIGTTLGRIALGLVLAFIVAFVVALASARNRFARSFFEPALLLGLTVPGLVWALLCVIWFGLSLKTSVVAIALGVGPALAVTLTQGVEAVDPQLIEAAHVYRLGFWSRLRNLWLPAILPFLLAGMRLAFSLAWKVVVLVEVFGLSTGVGYALNSAFIAQNVAAVLAWTLAFAVVVAAIEYGVFQTVESAVTRWKKKAQV